jgi:hypothetical protein
MGMAPRASSARPEHHAARGSIVPRLRSPRLRRERRGPGLSLAQIVAANVATVAAMRRTARGWEGCAGLARSAIRSRSDRSVDGRLLHDRSEGRHRCFDAVAILGYSAHHTRCRFRPVSRRARSRSKSSRYAWHWDDVPKPLVDLDVPDYTVPHDGSRCPVAQRRRSRRFAVDLLTPGLCRRRCRGDRRARVRRRRRARRRARSARGGAAYRRRATSRSTASRARRTCTTSPARGRCSGIGSWRGTPHAPRSRRSTRPLRRSHQPTASTRGFRSARPAQRNAAT